MGKQGLGMMQFALSRQNCQTSRFIWWGA